MAEMENETVEIQKKSLNCKKIKLVVLFIMNLLYMPRLTFVFKKPVVC